MVVRCVRYRYLLYIPSPTTENILSVHVSLARFIPFARSAQHALMVAVFLSSTLCVGSVPASTGHRATVRSHHVHVHVHDRLSPFRHCHSVESVLQQWQCRGRVLLLMFSPPDDMAVKTAVAYVEVSGFCSYSFLESRFDSSSK
jgi:hypothetical protein